MPMALGWTMQASRHKPQPTQSSATMVGRVPVQARAPGIGQWPAQAPHSGPA